MWLCVGGICARDQRNQENDRPERRGEPHHLLRGLMKCKKYARGQPRRPVAVGLAEVDALAEGGGLALDLHLGACAADLDRLLDRLAAVGQAQFVGTERHIR